MGIFRIMVADDHEVVRKGLVSLLQAQPDWQVCGEAGDGREAVDKATQLKPDVVILDIGMPSLNGLEATRQILKEVPSSKVLVLSSYSDDEYVHQLTEAGAAGYLLKEAVVTDLVKAIREVRKGRAFFSPAISKRLMNHYRETLIKGVLVRKRTDLLTQREAEVLQLIAEGEANKQIAAELSISIKTVERHRQRLMNRLGIHDIAGLTRYAISKGVIETGRPVRAL